MKRRLARRGASWRRAAASVLVTGVLVAGGSGALADAGVPAAAAAGQSPAVGMSGSQIAAAPRSPLPQGVPEVPPGGQVVGMVPATTTVSVDVALTLPDPGGLSSLVTAVSTPSSPDDGHYLTPAEFAARFSPAASTAAAVGRWLTAEGLTVGTVPGDRMYVPASGPAPSVAAAFGTSLASVRLPSGRQAFLPTVAPTVPSPVASTVSAVIGLSTVAVPQPMLAVGTSGTLTSGTPPTPAVGGGTAQVIGPSTAPSACAAGQGAGSSRSYTRLAGIYDMTPLYHQGRSGAGVTVALLELENYTASEITTFDACYGIDPTVHDVPVDGGPTASATSDAGLESSLDIETVAALAPSATVNVFQAPRTGRGNYDALQAIATTPAASVVSTSWGQCEAGAEQTAASPPLTEAGFFDQMAVEGKTVVAAAGDSGSEGCWYAGSQRTGTPIPPTTTTLAVDDPASQPTVTGVGGTRLGHPTSAASQVVWDTQGGASGGGVSALWSMPKYQQPAAPAARTYPTGVATCPNRATTTIAPTMCRAVPDVAADAAPSTGDVVFYDGRWRSEIGGTSAAAPLWAALFALADQGCGRAVGSANPKLYALGDAGSSAFTDVTQGDNFWVGTHAGKYPASTGYDLATGWGTPDAAQLVAALQPSGGCPVVTGLSTGVGPLGGGGTLTVDGTDLASATAVHFGTTAATIQSSSTTAVTVTVPPSSALDTVDVTVTTPNGTSAVVRSDRYSYTHDGGGYWESAADGGIFAFGDAGFYGSMGGQPLNAPVVGIAATPDDGGYWEVAADGGLFAFGDAGFYGSMGGQPLNAPVVGIAATPDGRGYWEVAADGGIFAFGDAGFYGSMGGQRLNQPIVGIAVAENGRGYWEVAADGGIFAFGDAGFYGSMGGQPLNAPVVGIATTPDDGGYWEVAADGGIFAFGNAGFYGSMGGQRLNAPVVGIAATPDGRGYWEVAADGGIFAFGDGQFRGSMGGRPLDAPTVGMATA